MQIKCIFYKKGMDITLDKIYELLDEDNLNYYIYDDCNAYRAFSKFIFEKIQ
jgi:hypothetical protein